MDEVTGPVVAVALVLCAVFVPCAFISGITGQFFRQFAVTIAVSTVFSAINSLTLSPALAAILLKPHGARARPARPGCSTGCSAGSSGSSTRLFEAGDRGLRLDGRAGCCASACLVLLVYGGLLVLTYWMFARAPTGFVPQQDQGRLIVNVQLPDSASLQRTQEAMAQIEKIARETPGVAHTIVDLAACRSCCRPTARTSARCSSSSSRSTSGRAPTCSDTAIMARLRRAWAQQVKDAQVIVFGAPPIPG